MAQILVIDDENHIRQLLRITLEAAGHQVREAREGREGMRLLRERPADVVFCDMFMDGQEGIETIRQLRREHPTVKVVAMSGGSCVSQDVLQSALLLGAASVLPKPFRLKDACDVVTNLQGGADSSTSEP